MVEVCTIVGIEQNQEAAIARIVASVCTAIYRLALPYCGWIGVVGWTGAPGA